MITILLRKLLVLLLFLPALHAFGFWYATVNNVEVVYNEKTGTLDLVRGSTPFATAYTQYLQEAWQGKFGRIGGQPLNKLIVGPIQRSMVLLLCGFVCSCLLGPVLGVLAVSAKTGRVRGPVQVGYTVAASIPGFFAATLLITGFLYAARYGLQNNHKTLLPIQGTGYDAHLIIPVIALAFRPTFFLAAMVASLLEHEFQRDYMRVARSKGLKNRMLLWNHGMPNISSQLFIGFGQVMRLMASTLILVETLIDWRGIGRLLMQTIAIGQRGDTPYAFHAPLLGFLLLMFGAILLVADLLASIVASAVDPRLRSGVQQ